MRIEAIYFGMIDTDLDEQITEFFTEEVGATFTSREFRPGINKRIINFNTEEDV